MSAAAAPAAVLLTYSSLVGSCAFLGRERKECPPNAHVATAHQQELQPKKWVKREMKTFPSMAFLCNDAEQPALFRKPGQVLQRCVLFLSS